MFRLRQIIRRRLCRAGFVIGCLAPLVALTAWGTYRHSPVHGHDEESSWRQFLGLRVHVGGVAHPRPGIVRYRNVDLADVETGKAVASCEQVEHRTSALDGSIKVTLNGVTIEHGGLASCYSLLQRMLRHEQDGDLNVTLAADRITIAGAAGSVLRLGGNVRTSDQDCEARFVLELPGAANQAATEEEKAKDRVLLRFARNHSAGTPNDEWELHTGTRRVPCAWFSAITGELPGLSQSEWQGSVWVKDVAQSQIALCGRVTNVDLATLVTPFFGHSIEGTVDVEFPKPVHFANGRIIEMGAVVTGGPGRISGSLLAAATSALGCGPKYDARHADEIFAYDCLGFEFRIDTRGQFAVVGPLPERARQLISDQQGRAVLCAPAVQPQPALNLVRAMAGAEGPTVPATPQAAMMLGRLPTAIPAAVVPATAARPQPAVPAKSSRTTSRLR